MQMLVSELRVLVEKAAADPDMLQRTEHRAAVEETIALVDAGQLRLAEPAGEGWVVNGWIQHAILQYFRITEMEVLDDPPFQFHDRIPLKHDLREQGIRVIPGGVVRYGAHLEPGVVVMPGFVNIGAYIGSGTMVDTWATVGSGAQIGRDVHLAGGVGIGGVLEPPGARPVIIEDGAFIGSRSIIVEGVHVEAGAVIAAQVSLTASTHIIDVREEQPITHKGRVPAGSIVVPGTRTRGFPGGLYQLNAALIIGSRTDAHDDKLALMEEARAFGADL